MWEMDAWLRYLQHVLYFERECVCEYMPLTSAETQVPESCRLVSLCNAAAAAAAAHQRDEVVCSVSSVDLTRRCATGRDGSLCCRRNLAYLLKRQTPTPMLSLLPRPSSAQQIIGGEHRPNSGGGRTLPVDQLRVMLGPDDRVVAGKGTLHHDTLAPCRLEAECSGAVVRE